MTVSAVHYVTEFDVRIVRSQQEPWAMVTGRYCLSAATITPTCVLYRQAGSDINLSTDSLETVESYVATFL